MGDYMKIAICDDSENDIRKIEEWIKEYFSVHNMKSPDIYIYHDGEEILSSNIIYDIAFIDVEMKLVDGITAGRYIMDNNDECLIFMITSHGEYIDDALRFKAFRYMVKPIGHDRFFSNLHDAIKIYITSNTKVIIETKTENRGFKASDIILFEADNHGLYVNTIKGRYKTVMKINCLEKILNMNCFVRTHRSYIVNLEHVTRFDRSLVYLDDGSIAYLTRRKYNDFKHSFMMYLEGARA